MTNDDIHVFLAVLEYGTFSAAAEKLYLSQSTLSGRIRALEKELGTPLFLRGRGLRTLELTPFGQRFIPIAEKWSGLWEEIQDAASFSERRFLRVCTFHSISNRILSDTYFRFAECQPSVQLQILSRRSVEIHHLVESGEADAALIAHPRYTPKLTTVALFSEPYYFVSQTLPERAQSILPSELDSRYEILLPNWDNTYVQWHDYWFGHSAPASIHIEGLSLMREFLRQPNYWAVVPAMVAHDLEQSIGLHVLPVQSPPPERTIHLITRTQNSITPELTDLIRSLRLSTQHADFKWSYSV